MSFRKGRAVVCRAVSPVIGVILMVAITVILAAVIGTFVMNMGPSESGPDNARLEFENSTGWLSIVHDGGEALSLSEYRVEVEMSTGGLHQAGMDEHYSGSEMTAGDQWNIDYTSSVSPPDKHLGRTVNVGSIKEVRIIWESPSTTQTQLVDTWSP
ncbi:hypothetical protein HLRTI_000233 [Halorhabdus tiamatea SARL4B]|uniref:Archaeal Type IV pilin N-terminal domain-containing protein n=1 Tax=Halorhabdus tiamatea SARL4B TaxID=1033806 RepID=U2FBZ3_9EURY|nr:type IV pilin N-terminal domain-containing protein [Halorhabdus tiamatea]ERJ07515.1 hypothetical protein HLRTI_000233 [Halorhabdus tiamatea SARL4B]